MMRETEKDGEFVCVRERERERERGGGGGGGTDGAERGVCIHRQTHKKIFSLIEVCSDKRTAN